MARAPKRTLRPEPPPQKVLVIQYEQFFCLEDSFTGANGIGVIQDNINEVIELAQQQGGFKATGSYITEDNDVFRQSIVHESIEFPVGKTTLDLS